jgi:hypothetical protein
LKTALAKRDFMAHYQSRRKALMQAVLMQAALQVSGSRFNPANAAPEGTVSE